MRAAFADIIDYAGLFPPASCTMDDAVRQYDVYRRSADRWMLGRFVLAATRLEELALSIARQRILLDSADPWHLSVVIGANTTADLGLIDGFEAAANPGIVADAIEAKVVSPAGGMVLAEQITARRQRYFEVPGTGPYIDLLAGIRRAGAVAKIRTGGMSPELFPATADVALFLKAVIATDVPFKATAGLHHPYRGCYPISYASDAERQVMYGFVNLLVAVAQLRRDPDDESVAAVLESPRDAFRWSAAGVMWRERLFGNSDLVAARSYFSSFGSCSFREPVDELGVAATT
ncbi:MAG: hypothetical protein ACREL5_09830 [Gemmatimonadales bacterium]